MATLVIRNGSILTMDPRRGTIENGAVVAEDGVLSYVGPAEGLPEAPGAEVIDATGRLVMPGLVNCHTHICMTFGRTLAPERTLLDWLGIQMPLLEALDAEAVYLAELLGCVENLKNGNTTIVENIFVPRGGEVAPETQAFRAMRDSGIRGTVARAFHGRACPAAFIETAEEQDARTAELAEAWHGAADDRLRLSIGPLLPWIVTEDQFRRTRALADRLGLAIHMHVAESPEFNTRIAEIFGRPVRQVELMHETGCLGPDVQAAAVCDVSDDEIALLAETGTPVIFDPQTRLYWGSGFPSIRPYVDAGIVCGLGTNGPAANCGQDLFESMKYACATAKTATGDPTALSCRDALAMATRDGARAIGLGATCGVLETGRRADIVTLDLAQPHLSPAFDLAAALVYSARGSDVRDVVVDGRIVVRDRTVLTVDESALLEAARDAATRALARAGLDATTAEARSAAHVA